MISWAFRWRLWIADIQNKVEFYATKLKIQSSSALKVEHDAQVRKHREQVQQSDSRIRVQIANGGVTGLTDLQLLALLQYVDPDLALSRKIEKDLGFIGRWHGRQPSIKAAERALGRLHAFGILTKIAESVDQRNALTRYQLAISQDQALKILEYNYYQRKPQIDQIRRRVADNQH